ncbi:hypothetical protein [Streptomyces noursei]
MFPDLFDGTWDLAEDAAVGEWSHDTLLEARDHSVGGVPLRPREIAAMRVYLTATDERIGLDGVFDAIGAQGFLYVASEVEAIKEDDLVGNVRKRRESIRLRRYLPRAVPEMGSKWFRNFIDNYTAATRRDESLMLARREGWVIWDRLNHTYLHDVFLTADDARTYTACVNRLFGRREYFDGLNLPSKDAI